MAEEEMSNILADCAREENKADRISALKSLFNPKKFSGEDYKIYSPTFIWLWVVAFIALVCNRTYKQGKCKHGLDYIEVTHFNYGRWYGGWDCKILEVHQKMIRYHINSDGDCYL